jgi:hypothetical protein
VDKGLTGEEKEVKEVAEVKEVKEVEERGISDLSWMLLDCDERATAPGGGLGCVGS